MKVTAECREYACDFKAEFEVNLLSCPTINMDEIPKEDRYLFSPDQPMLEAEDIIINCLFCPICNGILRLNYED